MAVNVHAAVCALIQYVRQEIREEQVVTKMCVFVSVCVCTRARARVCMSVYVHSVSLCVTVCLCESVYVTVSVPRIHIICMRHVYARTLYACKSL